MCLKALSGTSKLLLLLRADKRSGVVPSDCADDLWQFVHVVHKRNRWMLIKLLSASSGPLDKMETTLVCTDIFLTTNSKRE